MQAVRKVAIRFAALLAAAGVLASPSPAQEAADLFRIVAATSAAKLNAKSESKDRGVVVYVMRGWLDVFSTGMDELAAKMKTRGINAIAMSHSDHLIVAAEIIARHKKGIKERPVLIGHSLGANATASMAAELGKGGVHVPLIVMFDPTVVQSVPSNVGRAVNFFQSNNGWGVKVERGPGFKGKLENVDLFKEELGHTGIDKSPRLHLQSISFVQSLRGVRDPVEEIAPRPRPKVETAGGEKSAPAAETKQETKTGATPAASQAPFATVVTPASGEAKAPAAPAATEPRPAAEKPDDKPAAEKSTTTPANGKPDGLFSDIKRPTL
jgi:hypothetical protein